jgi:hypothetical protein
MIQELGADPHRNVRCLARRGVPDFEHPPATSASDRFQARRGAEFWVLGAVGSCLIKAIATSLAADLMIATGALPLFLKIDMAGGFNPNSRL